MKQRDWTPVKKIILENRTFVLTTHINPDGDGLGSEIALAEFLRLQGKDARIINCSPTPFNYSFLDNFKEILVYEPAKHLPLLEEADAFFILDISDWGRMREIANYLKITTKPKICIDHHQSTATFTDIDYIDPRVSSTGELIYELLENIGVKFNKRMAEAIYTCILTDTGSFRFSNTTPRAHTIASKFIAEGINSNRIYQEVYEQNSESKINLLGMILQSLKFECSGKVAWFNITKKMLEKSRASIWDTEGFADFPRSIRGVEVSLMFSELEDRKTKVSLRSKGHVVVNSIAMRLGGGGHEFASGALLEYPLHEANAIVLEETKRLFNYE
jgi:phosphoesterase RecJ-like protein